MKKICGTCKKEKELSEFSKTNTRKDGYQWNCKECNKQYRLLNKEKLKITQQAHYSKIKDSYNKKRKDRYKNDLEYRTKAINYTFKKTHGVLVHEKEEMISKQNNKCAICDKEFDDKIWSLRPCVDHEHNTGKVREVLCSGCNCAIGFLKEDINIIANAIKYIIKHKGE